MSFKIENGEITITLCGLPVDLSPLKPEIKKDGVGFSIIYPSQISMSCVMGFGSYSDSNLNSIDNTNLMAEIEALQNKKGLVESTNIEIALLDAKKGGFITNTILGNSSDEVVGHLPVAEWLQFVSYCKSYNLLRKSKTLFKKQNDMVTEIRHQLPSNLLASIFEEAATQIKNNNP